jgi:hypothetical protein
LYFCDFYASFYRFLKLGQIFGFEKIQKSIKNPERVDGLFSARRLATDGSHGLLSIGWLGLGLTR